MARFYLHPAYTHLILFVHIHTNKDIARVDLNPRTQVSQEGEKRVLMRLVSFPSAVRFHTV